MPSDDLRPWLRTQGIAGNTIYVLFLGLVLDWKPQILLQCCQKKLGSELRLSWCNRTVASPTALPKRRVLYHTNTDPSADLLFEFK